MQRAFAFKDKVHSSESTSGGAFSYIIKNFYAYGEGKVFGVIMDDELRVRYSSSDNLTGCGKFKKSKYVKADLGNSLKSIAELLKSGSRVIFFGIPCQVFRLKKYLESQSIDDNHIILVDIICNGAPEQNTWIIFADWLKTKYGNPLKEFYFREKTDKTNPYLTRAIFHNNKEIIDSAATACYNRLFLKKLIIPRGCFNCPFKKEERLGDITIADFWGANEVLDNPDLKSQSSLVLINSEKGYNLFCNNKSEDAIIIQEIFDKSYLKFQNNLLGGSPPPPLYDKFQKELKERGFEYVAKKYADGAFPYSLMHPIRKIIRRFRHIFDK